MKLMLLGTIMMTLILLSVTADENYGAIPWPPGLSNQAFYEMIVDETNNVIHADGSNSLALHGPTYMGAPNNNGGIVDLNYWGPTPQSAGLDYGAAQIQEIYFSYVVEETANTVAFAQFIGETEYNVTGLALNTNQMSGSIIYDGVPMNIIVHQGSHVEITSGGNTFNWNLDGDGVARIYFGVYMVAIDSDWSIGNEHFTVKRWLGHSLYTTLPSPQNS